MKFALILVLLCSQAYADCTKKQVQVAVIDTGFGYSFNPSTHLCPSGHKDFSKDDSYQITYLSNSWHLKPYRTYPYDSNGHGTNIVGIIQDYANKSKVDYCIVVLKYYSKNQSDGENFRASIAAIKYAIDQLKVDYINYSGGGTSANSEEKEAIERFLDNGGKLIAAAGNDGKNIGTGDNEYYPAMYDKRIVVVGNLSKSGIKAKTSNYGRFVNRWEIGENVTGYGVTLTGTSQATAVATGKILSSNTNKCDLAKKEVALQIK